MIPKKAVDDYLSRNLDSHVWMKELDADVVDKAIASLNPCPQLWPGLGIHQKISFLLGVAHPQFAYWLAMGCVDGDTEYLSPTGWQAIREYAGGLVAQYDPKTRQAKFVEPLRYINQPYKGKFFHFKTARGCDQMLTPDHNMLIVTRGVDPDHPRSTTASLWKHSPVAELGEYKTKPWFYQLSADELVTARAHVSGMLGKIETTFEYDGRGISLTDAQIRVQVAVHADGYLPNKSKVVIRVKKERKKQRLRRLLTAAGIEYKEGDCKRYLGYTNFRFAPPIMSKTYGVDWYEASSLQKRIICDEVAYWDGSVDRRPNKGVSFFTRSKSCADFIQFCFASTRRRAYLSTGRPTAEGKIDYHVHAIGNGRTTNLANLPKPQRVYTALRRKYCFEVPSGYLVLRRNGNIFVTGNSGKTLVALELLKYWWQVGKLRRGLIFVTSDKAFPTWENQIKRFEIDIPYTTIEGTFEEKWQAWDEFGDGLRLITYPGAVSFATKTVKTRKKNKWELDEDLVRKLNVDAVVIDESTRVAHHDSLAHNLLRRIMEPAPIRYALAGRPFGRDPTLLWAQHRLIDGGETFGPTLGLFREAFFISKANPWAARRGGRGKFVMDWKFDERKRKLLSDMVQHRSITYTEEECVDIPSWVSIVEEVNFPREAEAYYKRAVDTIIASKGNMREMKNLFVRMRQLSSGFVGLKDDETGARAEVEFDDNPKFDHLMELLEQLPEDRKALVFYEFTHSGRKIYRRASELGLRPIWLWSGTKDFRGDLARFEKDPECSVAIVNHKVGAYSLDGLQVANYVFVYESPVSCIDREQMERRVRRTGQKHKVFQYDLVVRGSMDAKILKYIQQGRDLYDAILRDPSVAREKA